MPQLDEMTASLRSSFSGSFPLSLGTEPHLRESLTHVLQAPGNLSRPRIVVQVAAAYDQSEALGSNLAIGLEYFHTASLIFDDLPCMDDAEERRGAACVHLHHGESGAILTALAIINRAYALVWQALAEIPRERQRVSLAYLERRLGVDGLLSGQSLDLHYASLPHDRETCERISLGKTVSLIRLALVMPALAGGAPGGEVLLLERIALFWGLSYQILDDLKDVLQAAHVTGKTASRDAALDRPNIVLILGVAGALTRLHRLIGLGDRAFERVLLMRPALRFLAELLADLRGEAVRATDAAYALQSQDSE